MNPRILTPIKDESPQNANRNPESFLNSLGFGSDALEEVDEVDLDCESTDGLMLSSQPDEISLPGLKGYQIPKRFGLEDLRPAFVPTTEKVSDPVSAPDALKTDNVEEESKNGESEEIEVSEPIEPSISSNGVPPAAEIIDSSVSFAIPPTAIVASSDSESVVQPLEEEAIAKEPEESVEIESSVEDEKSEAEEEVDPSLYLSCPKCDGELILQPEHLGIQGNCVWCEIPIIAAKSGADSSVQIFALENPHAKAVEKAETKSTVTEAVAAEPAPIAESESIADPEDVAEPEEEVVLPYQPELPENIVAGEIEIPQIEAPTTIAPEAPETNLVPQLPVSPKREEPLSEEAPQEQNPIFFADDAPVEYAAPSPVDAVPPSPLAAFTPEPVEEPPAQVSPFGPVTPSPETPPQDSKPKEAVLPVPGPFEDIAPATEQNPIPALPAETQVSPFAPPAAVPDATVTAEPAAPVEAPVVLSQVSPFGEPVPSQEVAEIPATPNSPFSPPLAEEPEPVIPPATTPSSDPEAVTTDGPPSPWGQPFQPLDAEPSPSTNANPPVFTDPNPSPAEETPAKLGDLIPVVPDTPPMDDDGFKISDSKEPEAVSSFADLAPNQSAPPAEENFGIEAVESPSSEIPTTFQSPFAPAAAVEESSEPDAPDLEVKMVGDPEDVETEKPLLYDPDDPDLPPEDPPKKKRGSKKKRGPISSGFSPDNPPPPPGAPPVGPDQQSGTAATAQGTAGPISLHAESEKKSGKSLSVLLIIMGLVTGVCVASFLLPMEDYISKARGYVDQKFGQKVAVPLVKPAGNLPSSGPPTSLPSPSQPKPPTSP